MAEDHYTPPEGDVVVTASVTMTFANGSSTTFTTPGHVIREGDRTRVGVMDAQKATDGEMFARVYDALQVRELKR